MKHGYTSIVRGFLKSGVEVNLADCGHTHPEENKALACGQRIAAKIEKGTYSELAMPYKISEVVTHFC